MSEHASEEAPSTTPGAAKKTALLIDTENLFQPYAAWFDASNVKAERAVRQRSGLNLFIPGKYSFVEAATRRARQGAAQDWAQRILDLLPIWVESRLGHLPDKAVSYGNWENSAVRLVDKGRRAKSMKFDHRNVDAVPDAAETTLIEDFNTFWQRENFGTVVFGGEDWRVRSEVHQHIWQTGLGKNWDTDSRGRKLGPDERDHTPLVLDDSKKTSDLRYAFVFAEKAEASKDRRRLKRHPTTPGLNRGDIRLIQEEGKPYWIWLNQVAIETAAWRMRSHVSIRKSIPAPAPPELDEPSEPASVDVPWMDLALALAASKTNADITLDDLFTETLRTALSQNLPAHAKPHVAAVVARLRAVVSDDRLVAQLGDLGKLDRNQDARIQLAAALLYPLIEQQPPLSPSHLLHEVDRLAREWHAKLNGTEPA